MLRCDSLNDTHESQAICKEQESKAQATTLYHVANAQKVSIANLGGKPCTFAGQRDSDDAIKRTRTT